IVIRITASAGKSFLDRMIALVEGAIRQRTPNEIALSLVLAAFTLIFLIVTAALWPMAFYAEQYMKDYLGPGQATRSLGTDVPTLVALLVCLIPTTIGALLAAIGIAGMDRALRANLLAKSGKAVEVAGDVDTLLLDKTGTITIGNRKATQFVPMGKYSVSELGQLAAHASFADLTPEGKSILELFAQSADGEGAAARSGRQPDRRPDRSGGHPQTRHARPFRAAAPHGPADGHGDGRQRADGQGHRRASRRGRLYRPGHARGQAGLHPQGAGRRQV